MTVIRCIEADARPPVAELPLEDADGFAIYAMADAMEGERWLRTTVLRRAGEAPPNNAVLVVEVDPTRERYDTRMHIAVTRATAVCTVFASAAAKTADERLSAVASTPGAGG